MALRADQHHRHSVEFQFRFTTSFGLHLIRIFSDGDVPSSVRSAMFIVTPTPDARPSSFRSGMGCGADRLPPAQWRVLKI